MVMKVMPVFESPEVGDVRTGVAMLVFPVVQEGKIIVAGVEPEEHEGGDPGGKHKSE